MVHVRTDPFTSLIHFQGMVSLIWVLTPLVGHLKTNNQIEISVHKRVGMCEVLEYAGQRISDHQITQMVSI